MEEENVVVDVSITPIGHDGSMVNCPTHYQGKQKCSEALCAFFSIKRGQPAIIALTNAKGQMAHLVLDKNGIVSLLF